MGIYKKNSLIEEIYDIKEDEVVFDVIEDQSGQMRKRYLVIKAENKPIITLCIHQHYPRKAKSIQEDIWDYISQRLEHEYFINSKDCEENPFRVSNKIIERKILEQREVTSITLPEGMTESEAKKILEDYKKNISKKFKRL